MYSRTKYEPDGGISRWESDDGISWGMTEQLSAREYVQELLAKECISLGLNEVYGVLTGKNKINGRSVRSVNFCKARVLDGTILIYSPTWIRITSNRTYPYVAKSLNEAIEYLKENF